MAKNWTIHHPCPDPECEDGEVTLVYEVGRGREDFILTEDDATCDQGHPVPQKVLDHWWTEDCQEYGEIEYAKLEEAHDVASTGGAAPFARGRVVRDGGSTQP